MAAAQRTQISVVALVEKGRVLLVHRRPDRQNYPDCWDLPGGHVEASESPQDAARRECLEELGVQVHDPSAVTMACSDPALDKHAFVATRWTGTPQNRAPDEHDQLAWFTVDELPTLTMADPRALADLAKTIRTAQQLLRAQRQERVGWSVELLRGGGSRVRGC